VTVQEIDPNELIPLQREWNRGLAVKFINDHLLDGGASLDVRTSIALYDGDRDFRYLVPQLPDEATLQRLFDQTNVRFWSKGC
jgi:hypothetical protein